MLNYALICQKIKKGEREFNDKKLDAFAAIIKELHEIVYSIAHGAINVPIGLLSFKSHSKHPKHPDRFSFLWVLDYNTLEKLSN